ncbi:2TM domain-containing protein [Mariniflexile litorale]|uniref:2TM domain-containing protein n=1 Tax=Mariniflexile litorale TaxID=3045158 RepID=A0AAU7ED14_9FLAO|nr:2TM domain-containing protein [Mariniflexile sp. KMM 9835]MDQ8212852.1 2TM domain-containing protein [Mariniflexile sp. KMM 9835]
MKNFRKSVILSFVIGCAVFVIGNALSGDFSFKSVNEFLINFFQYQLYSFVLGMSNMYFFDYMERYHWKKEDRIKRIVIGIVGSTVLTLLGLFFLRAFTSIVFYESSFQEFIASEKFSYYQFGLWITLTIVIIFHFVYFYNRYQQNKIKEQKVIAGTASAKFDALKNQLDPHFLFNSLNVLTSLIEENPENAQKFTTSLSKVYRYVLEQKNKELVSVDEELEFAKTYMSLLKMRFEDSIIFDIPEKANNSESKVVPLSLQLLLENAVKHNMVTSSKPLHIKIYEVGDSLVVENNLQPKQIVKKSSGVGLNNIMQRYDLLTTKKININKEASRFSVAIPMLTKQIYNMEMNHNYNEQDAYNKAKKRVEELKSFYSNLLSYCIVIPFLIFINYRTSWSFQWFWFPMLGWGMGLTFHAFGVFGYGKSWEERKIQEILEKEESSNSKTWK